MGTQKVIYLAGGCFWGIEKYISRICGVLETEAGYANGRTSSPTYHDVCHNNTGHAETVKVIYDEKMISLEELLELYFEVIDPVSINRQGADKGTQYRTGIYYVDKEDEERIRRVINALQDRYEENIAVEVMSLLNYHPAEEYHQKYLEKNPTGYCHIDEKKFENIKVKKKSEKETEKSNSEPVYTKKTEEELKEMLTETEYIVTQHRSTEPPFENEYYNLFRKGIYVDVTTGEPLFLSCQKFDSGCGWPSFARPISDELIVEIPDESFGLKRMEVRSVTGDAHLGHVFEDGPREMGGRRYCINSSALKFIPKESMEEEGYGYLLPYIR